MAEHDGVSMPTQAAGERQAHPQLALRIVLARLQQDGCEAVPGGELELGLGDIAREPQRMACRVGAGESAEEDRLERSDGEPRAHRSRGVVRGRGRATRLERL